MYDYREYSIAMAAIFLALALGILIGVSFGDNYLVSNQREIIEIMEQELDQRKILLSDKEKTLKRWEQIKPLIWRGYEKTLNGKFIIIVAMDNSRTAEIRALLENTGANVAVMGAEELMVNVSSERNRRSEDNLIYFRADLYVLLMEGKQTNPLAYDLADLWIRLQRNHSRVIAVYPCSGEAPAIPAGIEPYSAVQNIDTFWGQIALLELAVYGIQNDYIFGSQRQGFIPSGGEGP
jgi:hypothetical protein